MKKLLHKLHLNDVWTKQYEIERNLSKFLINKRLTEYFREQWISSAKHSHKGNDYLELSRFERNLKPYLNFILNDKSVEIMLKTRTGNHTLSVEIDRYNNK